MQRSQISQHIQMGSIGISDTRSALHAAIPWKWRIVDLASRDLDRMTCRQRGGEDSSAIGHLTDVDSLRMSASRQKWTFLGLTYFIADTAHRQHACLQSLQLADRECPLIEGLRTSSFCFGSSRI
jgi:hypothetical protein